MSIAGAIGSIRVILAESATIASVRNACRKFENRLSNITNKPLSSRSAKAVQKPTDAELNAIKATINGIVDEIESKLGGKNKGKDKKFAALIQRALEEKGLTEEKPKEFVDKSAWVVRNLKGRPVTVLRIMYARSQDIPKHAKKSETPDRIKINQNGSVVEFIDSIVGYAEEKLNPGLRNSLTQLTFGVSEAILDADLTLDKLRKFLEEAK